MKQIYEIKFYRKIFMERCQWLFWLYFHKILVQSIHWQIKAVHSLSSDDFWVLTKTNKFPEDSFSRIIFKVSPSFKIQFNEYNLFLCLTIQNSFRILEIATNFLRYTYRIWTIKVLTVSKVKKDVCYPYFSITGNIERTTEKSRNSENFHFLSNLNF